jgi:hypothetical protein
LEHSIVAKGIGFWRHNWTAIRVAFSEFKIVRDILIGTTVAALTLCIQVWQHLIPLADWQGHKKWWILSIVLPYIAVLGSDAIFRLAKAPWMLYREMEWAHAEELSKVKEQHSRELAAALEKQRSSDKLVIHSASYGTSEIDDVSVLDAVKNLPRDGLVIQVDNNLVKGRDDPAPNQPKRLRIEYSYGESSPHAIERLESQPGSPSRVVLPEDTEISRLNKAFQIVRQAAISAQQVQERLQQQLSETDRKHREELASLAKKLDQDTRNWPGDWKVAEDGFRRYERTLIRSRLVSRFFRPGRTLEPYRGHG